MRVKICGITNTEDALLCSRLGADAIGFIFYEKSSRNILYSKAEEVIRQLPPFIVKVGVFVDQHPDEINAVSKNIGLNAVQLYGDAAQSFIDEISLPVIKTLRINQRFDFSEFNRYSNCTFLLDTYTDKALGGTGESFDWKIIPTERRDKIILAGGISIDSLEYIFNKIRPAAIDLSSSLESSPGKKDSLKLKDFFNKYSKLKMGENEKL